MKSTPDNLSFATDKGHNLFDPADMRAKQFEQAQRLQNYREHQDEKQRQIFEYQKMYGLDEEPTDPRLLTDWGDIFQMDQTNNSPSK